MYCDKLCNVGVNALVEWSGGATGLDQWLPSYQLFLASWQTAFRSCRRFLHPLYSFRTAGFPSTAGSIAFLRDPSAWVFQAFDLRPGRTRGFWPFLSNPLVRQRRPQALGSARFI